MPSLAAGLFRLLAGSLGISALFLSVTLALRSSSPWTILWTAPVLLLASLLIAWAAESAQYFIAQGFALAILAWLQTLPEFAVEGVLAWHRETPLLLANLTGALRLLTGVGWPLIYVTAAFYYRRRKLGRLRHIQLDQHDSVPVVTLLVSLIWIFVMFFHGSLGLADSAILIVVYLGYLALLNRVPPESPEEIDEMELVPRAIVTASPRVRNVAIMGLFVGGGVLIYIVAEPFLASLIAVSTAVGISQFVAVQWIAPFVSEFPEKVSAFYWARSIDRAPMALMNMVSSNINQWTLLAAMLPIVLSLSAGTATTIRFDQQQSLELLMTAGQSLLGALLLLDLKLMWWEATGLFVLWAIQFGFSAAAGSGMQVHVGITVAYFAWCAVEVVRLILRAEEPPAIRAFREMVR